MDTIDQQMGTEGLRGKFLTWGGGGVLSEGLATAGEHEWEKRLQDCRLDANVNIIIIIIVSSFSHCPPASRPRRSEPHTGSGCTWVSTGNGLRGQA